ncbi:hypothetical protein [Streptomyces sp. NPDC058374]|uniref:hypothetical protein n=1 Tax=Streptomyces sp. NPDC058374 TaxID=3346466 RepID=UPI0036557DE1
MRTRLTTRSARLVLAATAVAALAVTTTACGPEDNGAAPAASAADSAKGGGADSGGDSGEEEAGSATGTQSSKGGESSGSGEQEKDGYGQSCGTNDLDFTLTPKSQAGGYYQVTAKAKSGVTCYLDVNTPSVSFGSNAEGVASPVGQGGEDPIKLSGSAVAYTGINPKTTKENSGTEFEHVIIATTEDDPHPAQLKLPEPALVEKPIVTNWSVNASETVPILV